MKLEQKLFLFILSVILSILFVFVALYHITNNKINVASENKIDTNKVLLDNFKSASESLNLLVKQIDLVIPKVHKELLNNKIDKKNKKDEIFYYENYGYKYLIFEKDSIFEKIYSGFSNEKINLDIKYKFLKLITNDTIRNNLEKGQAVNRIVEVNNENYIFSIKYLFTTEGEISGGVVVLLRLKLFIDLQNIINTKYICILNLNNNIFYKNNDVTYLQIKNKLLNTKANYSNSILEIENIKFIYKYNKYLDLHLVSYIEKELDIEKKYLLNSTYLSFFYIIIILIILILICYKWFANKLKDISRVGESIDYTKVSYLDDINKYYLNIYNNLINNDIKDKIIENILKIQSNTFELKKIIENSNNKIMKLKDLTSSYKNLEMNGNMLEINMSILCNQLEDNRLNDVLLMIKKTNQKLRDVNLDNVEVSTIKLEYNKLFSLFEKINNSIELLNSVEKNRINLLNNLKIKLDSKSNEIKRYN